MHTASDVEMMRRVRSHVTRRYIDSSRLDIRVMHGVVYVRGDIGHLRTHREVELHSEVETITRILRQQPGIREVIWETNVREA